MSDKPLRVAPTHGIEHREIARLTDLCKKVYKELQEATTDLSTARQSLYEVVGQRNMAYARVAELSRLAAMLASAVKCGEAWTETLEREYRKALSPDAPANLNWLCTGCGHRHGRFNGFCLDLSCKCPVAAPDAQREGT